MIKHAMTWADYKEQFNRLYINPLKRAHSKLRSVYNKAAPAVSDAVLRGVETIPVKPMVIGGELVRNAGRHAAAGLSAIAGSLTPNSSPWHGYFNTYSKIMQDKADTSNTEHPLVKVLSSDAHTGAASYLTGISAGALRGALSAGGTLTGLGGLAETRLSRAMSNAAEDIPGALRKSLGSVKPYLVAPARVSREGADLSFSHGVDVGLGVNEGLQFYTGKKIGDAAFRQAGKALTHLKHRMSSTPNTISTYTKIPDGDYYKIPPKAPRAGTKASIPPLDPDSADALMDAVDYGATSLISNQDKLRNAWRGFNNR